MSSSKYSMSFCVKCGQKTKWITPVILKMTRSRVPLLTGKCCKCKCNKASFVSLCYYKQKMQKCKSSKCSKRSGSRSTR